jgi:hypothetical protein
VRKLAIYHAVDIREVEIPVKRGIFGKKIRAKVYRVERIPERGTLIENEGMSLLEFLQKKGLFTSKDEIKPLENIKK